MLIFVYMRPECVVTFGSSNVVLSSNPVRPEWIIEGAPVARISLLSSSVDGTASTYFWDCTAGRFNWFYGFDETFHILEGNVTLKDPNGVSRKVTVGDTVFFPMGSSAEWTVDRYVRKLAFCRVPLPTYLMRVRNVVRRVRSVVRGSKADAGSGLL